MTPDFGPSKTVRTRWKYANRRVSIRRFIASIKSVISILRVQRKPKYLAECTPEQKVVFMALLAGDGR